MNADDLAKRERDYQSHREGLMIRLIAERGFDQIEAETLVAACESTAVDFVRDSPGYWLAIESCIGGARGSKPAPDWRA